MAGTLNHKYTARPSYLFPFAANDKCMKFLFLSTRSYQISAPDMFTVTSKDLSPVVKQNLSNLVNEIASHVFNQSKDIEENLPMSFMMSVEI